MLRISGHAAGLGQLEHLRRDLLALGDEDAGQLELEELLQRLAPLLRRERVEVGDLGLPEDVQPVGREAAGVPGQRQPRPGHLGVGQLTVEPQLAGQGLELERIAAAGEEVPESEHQSGLACEGRERRG